MINENPLNDLTTELSQLPGIGPKSAQRLAFYLISRPTHLVDKLAKSMTETRQKIKYCQTCFNISFSDTCFICTNHNRNQTELCIVASPRDIFAIERAQTYHGRYHVLGGVISPIDGIHPDALRISELMNRIQNHTFQEIIFAINPTIEGEATMLYLTNVLKQYPSINITKLAHGLPVGGDIDYADEMTLQKAVIGRTKVTHHD